MTETQVITFAVARVKAVDDFQDIKMTEEKKLMMDMTEEEIRAVMDEMTEVQREYVMAVTGEEREEELRERIMDKRRISQLITLLPQLQNWGSLPISPSSMPYECRYFDIGRSSFIFKLVFQNGIACIAKVSRELHPPIKLLSETGTIQLIRQHTHLPVPEVYLCETDPHNVLGAQYMLLECMEGEQLYKVWETMNLSDRKSVVKQMAKYLIDLSVVKFDTIVWYRQDGQTIGPFLHSMTNQLTGPLSTTLDHFTSFIPTSNNGTSS
jgi:Phosphotransferase enzyme family